jgi:hypothetical protein
MAHSPGCPCTIQLCIGERVQLHLATDLWMRGARYGEIVKFGTRYVHLKLDSGRRAKLRYHDVLKLTGSCA